MLVSWPCVFRETGFDFKHLGIQDHPNHEEMNPSRHNFNTRHGQLQIDWRGLLGIEAWGRAKKNITIHHHRHLCPHLHPYRHHHRTIVKVIVINICILLIAMVNVVIKVI